MRYYFYLPVALFMMAIVAAPSCKKPNEGFTQALVIETDDITPTGCGYLLSINSTQQLIKPKYLASAYQHDSLPVLIKYTGTGTQSNCMPQNPLDIVDINDIKREQ